MSNYSWALGLITIAKESVHLTQVTECISDHIYMDDVVWMPIYRAPKTIEIPMCVTSVPSLNTRLTAPKEKQTTKAT